MANLNDTLVNGDLRVIGNIYGKATTASQIGTSDVGEPGIPIYLDDGVPSACVPTAVITGTVAPGLESANGAVSSTLEFITTNRTGYIADGTHHKLYRRPASVLKFISATTDKAGEPGLVPAPAAGVSATFLKADGTWAETSSVRQVVTTTATGLYPVLIKNTTSTSTTNAQSRFVPGVTIQPSTSSIKATNFIGSLSGKAASAEKITNTAGSETLPIYINSNGIPTSVSHQISLPVAPASDPDAYVQIYGTADIKGQFCATSSNATASRVGIFVQTSSTNLTTWAVYMDQANSLNLIGKEIKKFTPRTSSSEASTGTFDGYMVWSPDIKKIIIGTLGNDPDAIYFT